MSRTAMKCFTDICGSQRMNPTDFDAPLILLCVEIDNFGLELNISTVLGWTVQIFMVPRG